MVTDKESKMEWVYCNKCLNKTQHDVLFEKVDKETEIIDREAEAWVSWAFKYSTLQCCGCKNVTFKKSEWCSEWDGSTEEFYPPPISRQIPPWHRGLNPQIKELLEEIYKALQADSKRLAMMGARAVVDMFITDQIGDIGGFERKLKELLKKGLISTTNKDFLDAALEAGHAAMHRGYEPTGDQVNQVMDIVENLLQTDILRKSAKSLKKTVPKRAKTKTP